MLKRLLTKIATLPLATYVFLQANFARAAESEGSGFNTLDNLNVIGKEAYGEGAVSADKTLPVIVATIIRQAMGLLGVIMVVIVLYAGFLWMTAGGNEEQVTKAKKWIRNAVIGIILIFLAYAITSFVLEAVLVSTGSTA